MTPRRAKAYPSMLQRSINLNHHGDEAVKLLRRYRFLLLDDYGNAPLQVERWLRRDKKLHPKRKAKGGKRG